MLNFYGPPKIEYERKKGLIMVLFQVFLLMGNFIARGMDCCNQVSSLCISATMGPPDPVSFGEASIIGLAFPQLFRGLLLTGDIACVPRSCHPGSTVPPPIPINSCFTALFSWFFLLFSYCFIFHCHLVYGNPSQGGSRLS